MKFLRNTLYFVQFILMQYILQNDDFYSRMKKLLSERRAFCTVDTAYEAIDSLEVIDQPDTTWVASSPQFDGIVTFL